MTFSPGDLAISLTLHNDNVDGPTIRYEGRKLCTISSMTPTSADQAIIGAALASMVPPSTLVSVFTNYVGQGTVISGVSQATLAAA